MTGLADVDGFKLFNQLCVWRRFLPLVTSFGAFLYLIVCSTYIVYYFNDG